MIQPPRLKFCGTVLKEAGGLGSGLKKHSIFLFGASISLAKGSNYTRIYFPLEEDP